VPRFAWQTAAQICAPWKPPPTSIWFPRCRAWRRSIRLHWLSLYRHNPLARMNRRMPQLQPIVAPAIAQNEIYATPVDDIRYDGCSCVREQPRLYKSPVGNTDTYPQPKIPIEPATSGSVRVRNGVARTLTRPLRSIQIGATGKCPCAQHKRQPPPAHQHPAQNLAQFPCGTHPHFMLNSPHANPRPNNHSVSTPNDQRPTTNY
jgi:hypothetical protein